MTEKPFSIALTPRAIDRCVFPTPGGPWMSSVSLARTQAQVASVSTRERSTEGWKAKSKLARVCPVGSPESRSEVLTLGAVAEP